jgi:hypothetical protein
MDFGQAATIWLARASAAAWLLSVLNWRRPWARAAWTGALALYLLHVVLAFACFYQWSHAVALRETARQTRELFGVDSGSGLYLNYLLTLVWTLDAAWWWRNPAGYRSRPRALTISVHAFLAFMFVNASLVVWWIKAFRHS